MKTVTIKTYSYAELSDKAKERARAWFREGMNYDGDCQIDDAKQCMAFLGFDIKEIYFSGFYSQGDGACFEGTWQASAVNAAGLKEHAPIDKELHRLADEFARLAKLEPEGSFRVDHRGHYSHKFCTEFSFDEMQSDMQDQSEKDLKEASRDCMEWIFRQLQTDYEWHNADEQVAESIECNDYQFTEDGKRSVYL
jgi:hypothetical protein